MIRIILSLIVSLSSTASVALAKDVEQRMQPTSPWNVQYNEEKCSLVRKFSVGGDAITAIFNRFDPGDKFQLMLAGNPIEKANGSGKAKFQFGPSEALQESTFRLRKLTDGTPTLLFTSLPRIAAPTAAELELLQEATINKVITLTPLDKNRLSAVTYLRVDAPLSKPLILELGALDAPFEALAKCVDDLLTTWGVSSEKHRNLTAHVKPIGNAGDWANARDLPQNLRAPGFSTTIRFRLIVDAAGNVSSCHIQEGDHPQLAELTCKLMMERAQFEPAVDANGDRIVSYWRNAVWWGSPKP